MMTWRALGTVLGGVGMAMATTAVAQDLSGEWVSDEFGYTVRIEQKNGLVQFIAQEDYRKAGYETLKRGDTIGSGRFDGRVLEGTGVMFHHRSTIANCGLASRSQTQARYTLSADGTALRGTEIAQDVGRDCKAASSSFAAGFTRIVAEAPGTCPQLQPIDGRAVKSAKISKYYSNYVRTILGASAQMTFKQAFGVANYGVETFKILQAQLAILEANAVPVLVNDKLPLLSAAVKQNRDPAALNDTARRLFASRDPADSLAGMPLCVAPPAESGGRYDLNLYGVDQAACKALLRSPNDLIKSVRINGNEGGTCEANVRVLDWQPWHSVGRNQVTLSINPWGTSLN